MKIVGEASIGLKSSAVPTQVGGKIPLSSQNESLGPAYTYASPASLPLPVLVAVPHAGRSYPEHVLANLRDEDLCQLRLEDRHVDQLGQAIAQATGIALLTAHAPRAMLDLNRAHDDVDWDMVAPKHHRDSMAQALASKRMSGANRRARSGLGLVPRRLPGFGEIWRSRLPREELDARIDHIHRPYHSFLASELARIRDEWGAALLIDLHSMPPLRAQEGQGRAPKIVLGDRFGASCRGSLISCAFRHIEMAGYDASHNRPYSGGYVLDRHAGPSRGIHAVQVEVCRSLYLDNQMRDVSPGLKPVADMLASLVRELGAETARLGDDGRFCEAAE